MLKKIILIIFLVMLVGAVLAGLLFWNQISWPVSSNSANVFFTIVSGQGVNDIAAALKTQNLIRSSFWFRVYVYLDGSGSQLIAGSYYLRQNMSTREMVKVLTGGVPAPEEQITIKEGWDVSDIAAYLDEKGVLTADAFVTAASVADSRDIIPDKTYDFLGGRPAGQGLEGFLFPDTYRVFDDATSAQIIAKMLDNFDTKFTGQMRQDTTQGNMSIYEIVTLASIIEKEVRTDADRKIAAGIFYDRLNLGVALQSDATVNYVTGKQALQPTNDDLAVDNRYNTYKYKGLPPGPICNPSLSSMMAAIYPTKTDYFYFLTKPDGSTVFSKTYEEHLENKRKYLQ